MNSDRDFNRLLDQWFADGPREVSDRVVVEVADRIERQSQRPAWRLPWRHTMNSPIKLIAALAATAIIAVAGWNLLPHNGGVGGPAVTPSPSASANPNVIRATVFGVPLTLTLSGGWTYDGGSASNLDLQHGDTDLGFHPLSMVTLPGPAVADPWIPVPADFVAWVEQRPEFTGFQTRPVTVGGRSGTEIDAAFVSNGGAAKRDFLRYSTGAWLYDQGDEGHRIRFIIVPGSPTDGFIIVVNAPAADFDTATTTLDVVLATVQFISPTASPSS